MAGGSEISAAFRALAEDAAQAGEKIGTSMSRFFEDTADKEDASVATHLAAEEANTQAAHAIRPPDENLPVGNATAAADPGAETPGQARIRRMLNGEDDSSIRQMSAEEPAMGWTNYKALSPKAKSLARALDRSGSVDIKRGEVGVGHLAELTKGYHGEVAITQGPEGDLKLIKGKGTRTKIPPDLFAKGHRFLVHTHPENGIPGDHNEFDKIRGIKSSMDDDLNFRRGGTSTHIEAVVNKLGDVTYFDHNGIISVFDHSGKYEGPLPVSGQSIPDGPINNHGFVFPVRSR